MRRLYLSLLLFLCLSFGVAQEIRIYHINVGQGDANLIISPTGKTVLIDAGDNGQGTNKVIPLLEILGIQSLDYVIASHYHADHIGGLDEVINRLGPNNIGTCYDRGTNPPLPTTVSYTSYATAAIAAGRQTIAPGQIIDLGGGVQMTCVASGGNVLNYGPVSNANSSENDLSTAFVIEYNRFRYYTGGDCGGEVSSYADLETPMAPQIGDVDVAKINHHGSRYSTNQYFINTIKPEVSIIEVGNGNNYGHPFQEILDRLANSNCKMYLTETGNGGTIPSGSGWVANDNILVRTNGNEYSVEYGDNLGTPAVIEGTVHHYSDDHPIINTYSFSPYAIQVLRYGRIISGSYHNLANNDDDYLLLSSSFSFFTPKIDWRTDVNISKPINSIRSLTITYSSGYKRSIYQGINQRLYLYNHIYDRWDLINSSYMGRTEKTITYALSSNFTHYINSNGDLYLRITANGGFLFGKIGCAADYVNVNITTQ